MAQRILCGLAVLLLTGCVSQQPPPEEPTQPGEAGEPVAFDLFLKSGYRLSLEPPAKNSPDRVAATPMVNGFANEDLRAFASEPLPRSLNISRVFLVVYYEVVAPSPDPFPNASNPLQARQIVFWAGSAGVYASSVSTTGETLLLPGRVYRAEAEIPLPKPGWIVTRGEPLQLLVATLAAHDQGAELRFLVDSPQTPSRLAIEATSDASPRPSTLYPLATDIEILGNAGMFTGATSDRLPSRVRTPIEVRTNDTFLEVRVLFRSNAAGKSDLDFELFAPDGSLAGVSSTPYQSETVRLFAPHLALHGGGTYHAEVTAYSGANTKYTLEARYGSPR